MPTIDSAIFDVAIATIDAKIAENRRMHKQSFEKCIGHRNTILPALNQEYRTLLDVRSTLLDNYQLYMGRPYVLLNCKANGEGNG